MGGWSHCTGTRWACEAWSPAAAASSACHRRSRAVGVVPPPSVAALAEEERLRLASAAETRGPDPEFGELLEQALANRGRELREALAAAHADGQAELAALLVTVEEEGAKAGC